MKKIKEFLIITIVASFECKMNQHSASLDLFSVELKFADSTPFTKLQYS